MFNNLNIFNNTFYGVDPVVIFNEQMETWIIIRVIVITHVLSVLQFFLMIAS